MPPSPEEAARIPVHGTLGEYWTVGFDALRARVAAYTPEEVAEITWIPASDIRKAAEMFATARSSAMYTFIGATTGGNSIATLRATGFLPALTGRVGQAGNNRFLLPTAVRMPGYYGQSQGSGLSKNLDQQLSAGRFPLLSGFWGSIPWSLMLMWSTE